MDSEKAANLLFDYSKILLGAGLIGIAIKESDSNSKYLIGSLLMTVFCMLIILGSYLMSQSNKNKK